MKKLFLISIFISIIEILHAQSYTSKQYKEDFEYFWNTIKSDYCYWDKKNTDWEKVKSLYAPAADTITTRDHFVLLLEKLFYELYDHHASLNTNTMESQRLVPSGADLWAEYVNGKPIITEVRINFGADHAGMKAGMVIIAFNDVAIEDAIRPFIARSMTKQDPEERNYALRVLLAGKHSQPRKITVLYKNKKLDFYPDQPINLLEKHQYNTEIESKILDGNIGYIRINNNLGDNHLISLFDSVLSKLSKTSGLILDLRETPGGGNTTVARSIMGRFILKAGFYQKHELTAEEREFGVKRSWMEIVSPKSTPYTKPLVILADHWTGSVSEGIVVGFDALKRATIIGTKMARLNGAVYSYTLPNTGIGFSFPVEKLFHVNGSPREKYIPNVLVNMEDSNAFGDVILKTGLDYLQKKIAVSNK